MASMRFLAVIVLLLSSEASSRAATTPHAASRKTIAEAEARIAAAVAQDSVESPGQVVVV
jgi:hypothetical protein